MADIDERIKQKVIENNRLLAEIAALKAELLRLQSEQLLPPLEIVPSLCAFCGDETGKYGEIMTSGDDYVCAECHQEFEDYLNNGDTE